MKKQPRFDRRGSLAAALIIAGLGGAMWRRAPHGKPVVVQTTKLFRQDLTSHVSGSGEIKPASWVNISAMAYGQITSILVKEGDRVKKGQELARLESVQPNADVEAQKQALAAAKSDMQAAESALHFSEASQRTAAADLARDEAQSARDAALRRRSEQLFLRHFVSHQDLDTSRAADLISIAAVARSRAAAAQTAAQVTQARHQLESAVRRVGQAAATLTRLTNVLSKYSFVSTLDGMVTNLPVHVGEFMVLGIQNSPGSLLMTIADMSVVNAEVKVDETDIINVKVNQEAEVTIDALPDRTFKGRVTDVGNSAIIRSTGQATSLSAVASQEAKDFKVVVTLFDPPPGLRPGLSATAKVRTAFSSKVLCCPIQAITTRKHSQLADGAVTQKAPSDPAAEIEGVFVVRDNLARFEPVKSGITGATDVEITGQVAENDVVVTGNYKTLRTLKAGASVQIDNDGAADPLN
jgi:HlyD family secretion protein